ncbi:hypothetical protein BD413DRAFT_312497, partial [Trametes elegans]
MSRHSGDSCLFQKLVHCPVSILCTIVGRWCCILLRSVTLSPWYRMLCSIKMFMNAHVQQHSRPHQDALPPTSFLLSSRQSRIRRPSTMQYHRADPSQGIDPPRAQNVQSMLRPIAPILSLPTELLMEVFRLYEEDAQKTATIYQSELELGGVREIPSESTCHWIPLMLVCRAWRAVGISTPVLWTGIEVFNHVEWLELALVRSRRRPVTLRFHHLSAALDAVGLLLPHTHRIRQLVLPSLESEYAGEDMQTFLPLLQSHMPLLTELTFMTSAHIQFLIDREHEEWPFVPFDSSPARLPALRILRLPCSLVPWMPSALSRLRSLHLSACEADQAQGKLSHKDFLVVLEACQELENLVLLDSFVSSATLGRPPSASDPDWAHPCTLLQLRYLRVDDDAAVISWLLSSLKLPEDAKIHVVG